MPAKTSARKRLGRSKSISETNSFTRLSDQGHVEVSSNDETVKQTKVIPSYGTKSCHKLRESLFSSSSGFGDYSGFLNLCVVLLALSNARLFLENLLKYGILVDPLQWISTAVHDPYRWPNLLIVLFSNVYIFASFYVERSLATKTITEKTGLWLHCVNLFCCILTPPVVTLSLKPNPFGSLFSCGCFVVVFLKLWSYAQTNKWYRYDYNETSNRKRFRKRTMSESPSTNNFNIEDIKIQYPFNLSYKNLYYFMMAPTLCYEINYPRSPSIRVVYLMKRIFEALFLVQLEMALVQQWVVPVLQKAILPISNLDGGRMLERLLKLAIPNHFIWIIFFYCFFHSILNILAELLRFGDREFYRDWWNAQTVVYFWKAWNIPVHKWCVRHLYKPLISTGASKFTAQFCVFMVSAIGHEYLVSIPLHLFRIWAFLGMLMQVPLIILTYYMATALPGRYGNMVVWMSLILGQPIAILAYVYRYYVDQYSVNEI